ncbi:MAG: hypothetical protein WDZ51_10030 [Pirellulaceae bacterium]
MPKQYLLTTPDGEQVSVQEKHAGERITTPSGKQVEVPTLRELKKLPLAPELPAAERAASSGRVWTRGLGMLFSGGLAIAAIGLVVIGVLAYLTPVHVDYPIVKQEVVTKELDGLPMSELLEFWNRSKDPQIFENLRGQMTGYYQHLALRQVFLYAILGCGIGVLLGFGLMATAIVMAGKKPNRRR